MRSFAVVVLVFGLSALSSSSQFSQSWAQPNGSPELSGNAALQYWQAFAQMPPLDADRQKLLDEWNTVRLDDPDVQKLLAESHASMKYLWRAAKLKECNWGLDYNDGISMMLPHLAKSRDLARLSALFARNEASRGNLGVLSKNGAALMALARHVGRDPFMVCLVMRFEIEGQVVDLIAPYIPEIKVPYEKTVEMFAALPPAPSVLQSIAVEKKFCIEWMPNELRKAEEQQKGAGLELWKAILGPDAPDEFKRIESLDAALQSIEDVYPVYDELAKLVALPKDDFDAAYPKFKNRVETDAPFTRIILPAMDKLMAKEHRNNVRMAMLLAAVAVVQSGPETLKDIPDPYGDGPFKYRALDKGFELQSNLLFEGQPVKLTLGQQSTKN
jgi:hypothetical protein